MNPKDFVSDRTGRVVKTSTGYWTFIPAPLPPAIAYDAGLTLLLSQADASCPAWGCTCRTRTF
jgi:hypothetical protein